MFGYCCVDFVALFLCCVCLLLSLFWVGEFGFLVDLFVVLIWVVVLVFAIGFGYLCFVDFVYLLALCLLVICLACLVGLIVCDLLCLDMCGCYYELFPG